MATDSRIPVQSTVPTGGNYVSGSMPNTFIGDGGQKLAEQDIGEATSLLDTYGEEQGRKAGAASQSNGLSPDGLDAPGFLGNLTKYGQAYHQAALAAYTAKAGDQIDSSISDLYRQHPTDTAAFAEGYQDIKQHLIDTAPPELQADISAHADQVYNGQYANVWRGQIEAGRNQAVGDNLTRYTNSQNQLTAMITNNPNDPGIAAKVSELDNIRKSLGMPLADGQPLVSGEKIAGLTAQTNSGMVMATLQHEFNAAPGLEGKHQWLAGLESGKVTSVNVNGQELPIGIAEQEQMTRKLNLDFGVLQSGMQQDRAAFETKLGAITSNMANGNSLPANTTIPQLLSQYAGLGASPEMVKEKSLELQKAQTFGNDANQMRGMSLQDSQAVVNKANADLANVSTDNPIARYEQRQMVANLQAIQNKRVEELKSDEVGLYAKEFPAQFAKADLSTDQGLTELGSKVQQQYGLTIAPLPKQLLAQLQQKLTDADSNKDPARRLPCLRIFSSDTRNTQRI